MKAAGVVAMSGLLGCEAETKTQTTKHPNIILIYTDDVGYGDVGCYGATKLKTPNIDKLASNGLRFTNSHAPSATCTPSRYAMLTGEYAWRRKGTGIAPGDAPMIIPTEKTTMADILKKAGYKTGVVGKWHLGLGDGNLDWNGSIRPGPEDIGFDYSFLIPATGDRVPCVYTENGKVVGLDPNDPIKVNYKKKIGNDPTGVENPELLKMKWSHGHNCTIVNGISRMGWMSGGNSARWIDEDMADVITEKAKAFIKDNKDGPFFLYYATHDIHVPRVPHQRFVGKSGLGPRGDAMVQLDWCTGELVNLLEELNLGDNTIVIFTSDNGPVLNDGYHDDAVEKLSGHKPAGPLRGGKYSAYDAGTRVPFIISWPGKIKPGKSDALMCQIDLMSSFAKLTGQSLAINEGLDSLELLDALLGKTENGRQNLVEHSISGTLSLIVGDWKYIEPSNGSKVAWQTGIETGNDPKPQLYNLKNDIGERNNLAHKKPGKIQEMAELLKIIRDKGRTRI